MPQDPTNLLCPFQRRWLQEDAPLAIGEKSRRIGWTWTQALGVVLDCVRGGRNYYHSSADQTASVEFIDYCAHWAEMVNQVAKVTEESEVIDDTAISSLVMKFSNGTKIVAGSSNPKFFRSKGGAVGLDEFAFHRDGRELYKAAHATALFWGHPLRVWSTHNGPTSYFNQMIRGAHAGTLKAKIHRVTIEDAVNDGIVERIDMRRKKLDHVPAPDAARRKDWIEELRATCPDQETWNEEYMCEPSSEGTKLLTYDLIGSCEVSNLALVDDVSKLPTDGGPLYGGYDIGRSKDLSCLWILQKVGDVFWTRMVKTLAKTSYTHQEEMLNLLMRNPNVRRVSIDKGLIGGMLAERQQERWGHRVEGVQFGLGTMAGLAMPLLRLMQDKRVRIPADAEIREDLHKVEKIVNGTQVRFVAPRDSDGHADRFWALALANQASDDLSLPLPPPVARKPAGW